MGTILFFAPNVFFKNNVITHDIDFKNTVWHKRWKNEKIVIKLLFDRIISLYQNCEKYIIKYFSIATPVSLYYLSVSIF